MSQFRSNSVSLSYHNAYGLTLFLARPVPWLLSTLLNLWGFISPCNTFLLLVMVPASQKNSSESAMCFHSQIRVNIPMQVSTRKQKHISLWPINATGFREVISATGGLQVGNASHRISISWLENTVAFSENSSLLPYTKELSKYFFFLRIGEMALSITQFF